MTGHNEDYCIKVGQSICMFILCVAALVVACLTYNAVNRPLLQDGRVPSYQRARIESYCLLHKVRPSVVEINQNGRMFYLLDNGKRVEIR